jgi:putative hemolysin
MNRFVRTRKRLTSRLMTQVFVEIAVLATLIILNGLFAMTEMALVSARKARLRAMADNGDSAAVLALSLAESPNQFLPTVQIGITLIGILAGAFGGASIADKLGSLLEQLPFVGVYGEELAFALVVVSITFFSLVLGELVPKRLALRSPEKISRIMAHPMQWLAHLASPAVHVLSISTEGLLRLVGSREQNVASVTEEELAGMIQEGFEAGVLYRAESQMVHSVLALDRLHVEDIMTPRPRIVWLSADDANDQVWHKIVVSNHSHFPVFDGTPDNVLGFVSVKSIYANLAAGVSTDLRSLVVPALVVLEMQSAMQLLETFKNERKHIALVADEFGVVSGVVTLNDILEAIVGEMPDASQKETRAFTKRDDGSFLIDGLVGVEELEERFPAFVLSREEKRRYSTLGGFICERLGHIPIEAEKFEYQGYRFEVVDMDRQRVDKVLMCKIE